MNHLSNIKDLFSIPSGNRNVAPSSFSSLSDSQLLLGSQFWLENSQGASQEMSLSSRNSQRSSEEGSDPKFLSTYLSKPLLFGDLKEKPRTLGILDRFEEDRKNAKEKTDNDLLAKECQHIRETLSNMQQMVSGSERNAAEVQTLLEKFDKFVSLLQNNLNHLQSEISGQFDSVVSSVNSQTEMMMELDRKMQKSGDITAELNSQMEILKSNLESLKGEQDRERLMLEEALKHLSTLVSLYSSRTGTERVMDSAIQTSPALLQSVLSGLQEKKLPGAQLACASQDLEKNQGEVPRKDHGGIIGKKRLTQGLQRRFKKRPLVPLQKRKSPVSKENSQPPVNRSNSQLYVGTNKNSVASDALVKRQPKTREGTGGFITPLSFWSQDSSSSVEIETILDKLSAESSRGAMATPAGLWQLFDMNDSDVEIWRDE